MREITIGTRSSKLAIIQAEELQNKLREIFPDLKSSLVKIKTSGDRHSATALDEFAKPGIFVKELEKTLLDRQIDLAVHSLKDLPTEIPDGLILAAATARLDPRDVLISRAGSLAELAGGSKIGTGSRRRAVQLLALRPELQICGIRGNVDTRLRKVSDGEFDGIVVAAAAMRRLGYEDRITEYLPIEHVTPAVGQGALGIEIRAEDKEIASIISRINDVGTWQAVTAERTFLQAMGGGCRAPIAALGIVSGGILKLTGMAASTEGSRILRATEQDDASKPEQIGMRLARKMVELGALSLVTADGEPSQSQQSR
jgi:hydroxymethylbilane synthase